jgi:mono/diheme cytochrome c family protein
MPYEYSTDEQLDRSTNTWMAAGVGLLIVMAAMFPLYRWYEPAARADSREAQAASLALEGATVWEFNCASCHGDVGEGGSAPTLNAKQFLQTATDEQIRTLSAVGVPGTRMSAFSLDFGGPLTSEQIKSVAAHMRSWEADAPDVPSWREGRPDG